MEVCIYSFGMDILESRVLINIIDGAHIDVSLQTYILICTFSDAYFAYPLAFPVPCNMIPSDSSEGSNECCPIYAVNVLTNRCWHF